MTGLKAVLFDKDGTFLDFDCTWGPAAGAVIAALAAGDVEKERRLQEVSQYLPQEARFLPTSPVVAGSSAHYGPVWAEALGRDADHHFLSLIDRLFSQESMRFLTPIGAPGQVFDALSAGGLKLAVVTNDAEANARRQIEALGLAHHFAAVHGYDSGYGSKPDPGMVQACAQLLGHAAQDVAVVGDTGHDLAAARGAGARFILVRSGPMAVDHLLDEADLVVETIDELPARLLP